MDIVKAEYTFLVSSLSGGGSERICINLANAITEQGYRVNVLYLYKTDNQPKSLNNNVCLICLNTGSAVASIFKLTKYIKRNSVNKLVTFKYELAAVLVLSKFAYNKI